MAKVFESKKFYRVDEVAAIFKLSERTVRRMTTSKSSKLSEQAELPSILVGGSIRFVGADLNDYVAVRDRKKMELE